MSTQGQSGLRPPKERLVCGLEALLNASEYAIDAQRLVADFAIEIHVLNEIGLGNSELRWLVCKGYVQHYVDLTHLDQSGRLVTQTESLCLTPASCFVITPAGVAFARSCCANTGTDGSRSDDDLMSNRMIPSWDTETRVLRLGPHTLAQFRARAPAQEEILVAFEEEGWPDRIDDPLTPMKDVDTKARLKKAVHRLNKHLEAAHIHFCSDSGTAVRWHRNGQCPVASHLFSDENETPDSD